MTPTKFTPGPWQLNPRASMTIQSVEGRGIASVSYSSTVNPDAVYEENQANAHLIAAATELYEALEGALEVANALMIRHKESAIGANHTKLTAASRALSRARGEEIAE